ncbi:hypothetical protein Tco_0034268 [Tanacetum coccineum]
MGNSVILISLDSLDESVGSFPSRIILFGTILAEIPIKTPTIPPIVSTLLRISLFLYTDSSDSDTSERPPLQDPYEVTIAQWRSRVAARSSPPSSSTHDSSPTDVTPPTLCHILPTPPSLPCQSAVLVLPSQLIPFGRPYRNQPNRVRKMLIGRKRVRALPSGRLVSRYPPDHSSSDHFSSDDSSSDSSSDYSSNSSLGHSLPDSSIDATATIFVGPSRKRCRSPTVSVPLATPISGALSPICFDLLPPRKRIRDVQADIDADTVDVEAATARESDVRVEVGIGSDREDRAKEEAEFEDRGTIEIGVDRVTKHVVLDDVYESASDDIHKSANERGLYALMQELHDHLVEIHV